MEYVAGLMFSRDYSKLAMVKKIKPVWQAGNFNAIGGKIEPGENPETAMAREFLEETGVQTTPDEWKYIVRLDGQWGSVVFYVMYSDKVFDVQTIEEEEIHLVDPFHLPYNVIDNIRWLVPLALDQNVILPESLSYL